MNIYIIAKERCGVLINGVFAGIADGNLRRFPHCGRNLSIQFLPDDKNYMPVTAFFGTPKSGFFGDIVSVKTDDGYLLFPVLKARFTEKCGVIYKKTFTSEHVVLSVSADPFCKITVLTEDDYYFSELKYYSENAEISARICGKILYAEVKAKHSFLYVFNLSPTITRLYAGETNSVAFDDKTVTVIKKPVGATGCLLTEIYSLEDFSLIEKKTERKCAIYALPPALIPCAFLEELQHGGDYCAYLTPSLKENGSLIPSFFGNFLFFIPYFSGDKFFAALVYDNKVERVCFTLENNVIISDFTFA